MNAIIRAEWRKLRTSRATMLLLVAGLAYAVLNGVATAALAGRDGSAELGTASNVANILRGGNVAMWVMLLVGILTVTTEYRHRTVTTTFLATPRRGAVVAGKLAVAAALGGAYAVLGIVVGLLAALPRLTGAAAIEVADAHVAATVGGAVLGTALFAVAGVGIGALVRNQTVAVAGALVWFLPAENIVGSVVGWPIARWLPGQAAASATGAGGGTLLPMAAGAVLFAGYTAVATVAGTRLAVSRDVT